MTNAPVFALVRAVGDVQDRLRPALYARKMFTMSTDNARKKSKMGRPTVDTEELRARVERSVIVALEAYAADEGMTRPQAIRAVLTNWLRTHGYKITSDKKPVGPATDAVEAMDKAIKEHRGATPSVKTASTKRSRTSRA